MRCKKYIGILSVLMAMILCSGCSLAVDGGDKKQKDELVGVFITMEELEEFDSLNDILGENVEDKYANVYATVDKSLGEEPSEWKFKFGDWEGICLIDVVLEKNGETYSYYMTDGVYDIGRFCGEEERLEGKISIVAPESYSSEDDFLEDILHVNPVYCTSDGEYYFVPTMGERFSWGDATFSYSDEYTKKIGGEKVTQKKGYSITCEHIYEPLSYRILQMDKENHVIKDEKCQVGQLGDTYEIEKETAYIILETEVYTDMEDERITREIYKCTEDNFFPVKYPVQNRIWGQKDVEIIRK